MFSEYLQSCGGRGPKTTGNCTKVSFREGPSSGRAWKLALQMHLGYDGVTSPSSLGRTEPCHVFGMPKLHGPGSVGLP